VLVDAAPTTFFGEDLNGNPAARIAHPNADAAQASFFSNLTGVGTETFESFAGGLTAPLTLTFPGAGTAALGPAGAGTVTTITSGTNNAGRYPISCNNHVDTSQSLTITFNNPGGFAAFGFYGVDVGDFGGQLTLTLTLAAGGTETLTVPNAIANGTGTPPDGSVLYCGMYDKANPFTSIVFGDSQPAVDFFGFDNMTIGSITQVTPTPEPTSLVMGSTAGLVGMGYWWRRRLRSRS
jgi:hypothetical protein